MTYIAFDIDGTIFDCNDIIIDAFQLGIAIFNKQSSMDIALPNKDIIMSMIGMPTDIIFKRLFPELGAHHLKRVVDYCTQGLAQIICEGGGELFDDVYVTLETIYNRGYTMLVASNGKIDYIEAILNSKDIKKYFTYPIVTIDNMIRGKNDIVRYYKETISKNNLLIMIGDRESDMIAAIENGIPFIGCSFGFSENNEFKDLKWRVNRFSKIPCIIRTIEKELR